MDRRRWNLLWTGMGILVLGSMAQVLHAGVYRYTVDRSAVPSLSFNHLTLKLKVGTVDTVDVLVDGSPHPFSYDAGTGWVMVTTPGTAVDVVLTGEDPAAPGFGQVQKAALRGDKLWAWSHGMDDNTNQWCGDDDSCNSIQHFVSKGYRATVYLIAEYVDTVTHDVNGDPAVRNESWILDEGQLQTLISLGWGIGNHTVTHDCASSADIAQANAVLAGVMSRSVTPGRKLLLFAAPNFDNACDALIVGAYGLTATDGGTTYTTGLLINENGSGVSDSLILETLETSGGVDVLDASRHIVKLFRDSGGYDAAHVEARFDELHSASIPSAHRWFNSLTHADGDAVKDFVDYFDAHYGSNGTDEAWMAPADEIYSYHLVWKYAQVAGPIVSPGPPAAPRNLKIR